MQQTELGTCAKPVCSSRLISMGLPVNLNKELSTLVDDTLNLGGRAATFVESTPLLGAVPELDSMGVVSLITALEEHFGISINDDEIDGAVFQTFGTLKAFVSGKLIG